MRRTFALAAVVVTLVVGARLAAATSSSASPGARCRLGEIGTSRTVGADTVRCERRQGRRIWVAIPNAGATTPVKPTTGTTPATTRSLQNGAVTMSFGGSQRRYVLHVPPTASDRPSPLVVVLHGGLGSAAQAENSYRWDELADRVGAVIAYPEGTSAAIGHAWNAGICCGPPAQQGVDDVGFIDNMIGDLLRSGHIDATRIYATGISNGAMLSYRLACDRPGRFAAIGPVAGTITSDCPSPSPISVLHIHGLADQNVTMDGSISKGLAKQTRTPVQESIDRFRSAAKCPDASTRSDGAVTYQRAACSNGIDVDLITIAGAGHQWPGSVPATGAAASLVDPPSNALDATGELWSFFERHHR